MCNIKIRVSDSMTEYSGMYGNENAMLRIPRVLRDKLKLTPGQQLSINTNDGTKITLRVNTAYKSDAEHDEELCYVTKQIFDLINIEGTNMYEVTPVEGITLGCDPEFFLVDAITKKILRAHMFFNKWGEIGHDGILAELRPKPSLTPQGLTDNIWQLFQDTRNILTTNSVYDPNRIMMLAASGYQMATAGFHLHFGIPKDILGKTPTNVMLMHQIVRVMDYYVGLPAIMMEGEQDTARRSNIFVRYGKPSDFRLDHRTLEYRVAGGNLLRHPLLTKGLIALGEVVTQDIISRIKLSTNDFKELYWVNNERRFGEMYPNVLNTSDTYNLICSPSLVAAKQHLDTIYEGIKNMIGYERRREEIDVFFDHILNDIQYNNNIEYNWRKFYEQSAKFHQPADAPAAFSAGSELF